MGITNFSFDLLKKAKGVHSVIEIGSQNDYRVPSDKPPFATNLYKELGINDYTCIDLAGDNYALQFDLGKPINHTRQYDLVSDFGSSDHVVKMDAYTKTAFHDGHINSIYPSIVSNIEEGYYNCWLNKHNLCKIGGFIISENPMTGSWPEHGYSYLGKNFYDELSKISDYEIVEQGEEAATGNAIDGWNKWAILRKEGSRFPSFEDFIKLPIFRK